MHVPSSLYTTKTRNYDHNPNYECSMHTWSSGGFRHLQPTSIILSEEEEVGVLGLTSSCLCLSSTVVMRTSSSVNLPLTSLKFASMEFCITCNMLWNLADWAYLWTILCGKSCWAQHLSLSPLVSYWQCFSLLPSHDTSCCMLWRFWYEHLIHINRLKWLLTSWVERPNSLLSSRRTETQTACWVHGRLIPCRTVKKHGYLSE